MRRPYKTIHHYHENGLPLCGKNGKAHMDSYYHCKECLEELRKAIKILMGMPPKQIGHKP